MPRQFQIGLGQLTVCAKSDEVIANMAAENGVGSCLNHSRRFVMEEGSPAATKGIQRRGEADGFEKSLQS